MVIGNCQVNPITNYQLPITNYQICAIAVGQYKVLIKIATVLRKFYISHIPNLTAIPISLN